MRPENCLANPCFSVKAVNIIIRLLFRADCPKARCRGAAALRTGGATLDVARLLQHPIEASAISEGITRGSHENGQLSERVVASKGLTDNFMKGHVRHYFFTRVTLSNVCGAGGI